MDAAIENALRTDRTIDITTTGRTSGEPRRIEIWFHRTPEGRYFITGRPGRRAWYANLLANPDLTFHLKESAQADLPATARVITDAAEKEAVLRSLPWIQGNADVSIPDWVAGAPLVEVRFHAQQ
ncbi:MAG: nitroreductase family deazaflavin-dependent oxidoreductase [Dehalococcoidia bacterium]|nr:nitroreductase family deazaflavin-dependent oxidoreductase [Dehalococcoidia bacterium]